MMRKAVISSLLGWSVLVATSMVTFILQPSAVAFAFAFRTASIASFSTTKLPSSSTSRCTRTTTQLAAAVGGGGVIDTCPLEHIVLDENYQRDISTFQQWAFENCGVQKSEGFDLAFNSQQQEDSGNQLDYFAITRTPLKQGDPVLYVPENMIITSTKAEQEFGNLLTSAKNELVAADMQDIIPLFMIFVKILVEYQKALESPYYPWLNSLPRLYNTGASMTFACFECLPDYASLKALQERKQCVTFQKAAQYLSPIFGCRGSVLSDIDALKWAYNVAVTRSFEVTNNGGGGGGGGERYLAPMADMFNHGSTLETIEVQVSLDETTGNCVAFALKDIPAGSPLRMSYGVGDQYKTNPTPLFATYGFLDESSPATFCKVMHLQKEIEELGYDYSNLLFYKDTGDISMEVYDVMLYGALKRKTNEVDPQLAIGFRDAVLNGDSVLKNQYHERYFQQYTKEALQKHVYTFLNKIDKLAQKATSYDIATHPRVPVIMKHNAFVKETFMKVKQKLDNM